MAAVAVIAPTRPVLRWFGGKWVLAPWIIAQFPRHRVYVEPFGGAWSVGMRKPPAPAEIWNDLDAELVNFFRALRDDALAARMVAQLQLTPFARDEFYAAYEPCEDPVERARRLTIRSFMGHGADGGSGIYRTGFRANSRKSNTGGAPDWANLPAGLELAIRRLKSVTIENRPAMQVMATHDGPETLHFVDPPYLQETRARANRRPDNGGVYRHELTTEEHIELLTFLRGLRGMVVLCGYPAKVYDDLLADWRRLERPAMADGALPRTEVLWINPLAAERLAHGPLFMEAAA